MQDPQPEPPARSAKRGTVVLALILAALSVAATRRTSEPPVDFNRDIRPILADKCFRCHGPDAGERKRGLRLDHRDVAIAPLRSGATAIVPGHPEESELIARVTSADPGERMPPAKAGPALSHEEQELLRRWIAEGAPYARHWSFVPPKRSPLPPVSDPTWPRHAIDHFVLARLDREGLSPSPPANRLVLARRVALDVTGLPPDPHVVDAFANDTEPDAYERFVDDLLRSPAYGERWARVWLDLARYADSAGYAQDPPRTIWRYRDWVIEALNDNLPFDRFTILQLAGDLLPEPTDSQLIATAFHRNTMTNSEGGTDDEEFRNAAVVDRVNTTMQVWMGLTMGCAQCHDHKYDPLSQEEYYRFFAVFNNTADADRGDESPTLRTLSPEEEQKKTQLQARIAALQQEIADAESAKAEKGRALSPLATRYVRVELPGETRVLSLAEVEVFTRSTPDCNIAVGGTATQSSTAFEGVAPRAIDGTADGGYGRAKSTSHTATEANPWWEVDLGEPRPIERIIVWNRTDHELQHRLDGARVVLLDEDRRPLWVAPIAKGPEINVTLDAPEAAEALTAADREALDAREAEPDPRTRDVNQLQNELAGLGDATPILRELPAEKRRTTHVHLRGSFLSKGAAVEPGVPAALHPLPEGVAADRLAVARWLVSADNPLTARVVVNRTWEQLFGRGLVESSEDFGNQGTPPTHPELLDHLAVTWMADGQDMKRLIKEIVTSATYRQASAVSPELAERDRFNTLLARGPRFRLSAEMIRDQALAVSGLLSHKRYGPSVQPPQPNLGLNAAFGGSTDWTTSGGEDRYRRGLYTSWRRTSPYPSMSTFDAPSRELCTVRRIPTNTPLQALVTLNDPVFVEAAQALARRITTDGGTSNEERAEHAFRLCLIRPPQPAELARLVALFDDAAATMAAAPERARALATEPLGPAPENAGVVGLAAWTVVSNVLMNLDEFLARP